MKSELYGKTCLHLKTIYVELQTITTTEFKNTLQIWRHTNIKSFIYYM